MGKQVHCKSFEDLEVGDRILDNNRLWYVEEIRTEEYWMRVKTYGDCRGSEARFGGTTMVYRGTYNVNEGGYEDLLIDDIAPASAYLLVSDA